MKKVAGMLMMALVSGLGASSAMAEGYAAIDLGNTHAADVCRTPAAGCTGGATAMRIAGGYQFQQNWAAEVSYGDYGKGSLGNNPNGTPRGNWKASGLQVSLIGSLPISNELSFFTKVGLAMNNFSYAAASASNNTITGGFGVRYNIDKQFAVRVQYENLGTVGEVATTGLTRLSLFTFGGVMKF